MKITDIILMTQKTKDEIAVIRLQVKLALYKKAMAEKKLQLVALKGLSSIKNI